MREYSAKALSASFLVHITLAALLYFGYPAKPVEAPQAVPAWVDLLGDGEPVVKREPAPESSQKSSSQKSGKSHKEAKDFSLNAQSAMRDRWLSGDLEVGDNADTNSTTPSADSADSAVSSDPMTKVGGAGHGFSKSVQYSQAMSLSFLNENLSYFQALHQRVDGALVFPEDFVRARLEGKVRVELILAGNGTLLEVTSLRASHDVLHAYVLTLLIHTLKAPLPERSHLQAERAVVVFDFDFKVRIEGNDPSTLQVGVQKNRLLFAREGMTDPWVNEKLREVFTHYIPPIIPIPGGFYIDFVMAYQYVQNLRTNAPVESEAREARIKQLHLDLLQTIRSSRPAQGS